MACLKAKKMGLERRRPTKSESVLEKRKWDDLELSNKMWYAEHHIMGYRLLSADALLGACSAKLAWKDVEIVRLKRLLRRALRANGSACVRRNNSG